MDALEDEAALLAAHHDIPLDDALGTVIELAAVNHWNTANLT